ncbi:MAG: HAD family hydrolase [Smithellaceae bacterium]
MGFLSIDQISLNSVIFDFDGTLAKLNIDFHLMRQEIVELINVWDVCLKNPNRSFVLEMIHEAEVHLRLQSISDAQSFHAEAFRTIEKIEVQAALNGELFEWTRELLSALSESGIHTGIITRNCAKAVYTVFPDVSRYCGVILAREHVVQVKPHPDHLNAALRLLQSPPCHTLMVGDHPLDVETGLAAGTWSAGVLTGHHSRNDFEQAGAHWVLDHAFDLLSMIRH